MTGASDALTALHDTCTPLLADVAVAVRDAAKAQGQFRGADDLLPAWADTVAVILALERLTKATKVAEQGMRAALAASMDYNNAPSIRADSHIVGITDGRTSVEILDAAAVPAELMTTPMPQPDKKKLGVWLKTNTVNWARLVPGTPTLFIRSSEA